MNARFVHLRLLCTVASAATMIGSFAMAQDAPEPAAPPTIPPTTEPIAEPPTPPAASRPVARTDLPAAKDIIGNCVEAMGGEKAFDDMKSSMVKATFTNPMGEAKIEMMWMKPNMVLIKQAMQGMESTMGSDGTVAWMKNPMGAQILDPDGARDLQDQANMFRMILRMREESKELATVDQTKFGEFDCYKVMAIDKNDQQQFAFFDVKDRLIRGLETNEGGQGAAIVRFSEWKEDAGIKYFSKVEIEQMGMTMPLTFDEVKFNTLDETTFVLPDEIKALLKEQEGAGGEPGDAPTAPPVEPDGN